MALGPQDQEQVAVELAQILVRRQTLSSRTSFLGFCLMGWLMRPVVELGLVVAWVAALALAECVNLWLLRQLRRHADRTDTRTRWVHRLTLSLFVYGLVWGLASVMPALVQETELYFTILLFLAAVMLFGLNNLVVQRRALLAFSLGIAMPTVLAGAWGGTGPQVDLALGAVALIVMVQFYGHSAHQRLRTSIEGTIYNRKLAQELARSNADLKLAMDQLVELASKDPLTHCLNRRAIMEFLEQETLRIERYGGSFSLLMFDLDHFKAVNDRHGHGAGDAVLVEVASRIRSGLRASDRLARWGGEEFLCVLVQTDAHTMATKALELCQLLSRAPIRVDADLLLTVTASCGAALCGPDQALAAVIAQADEALYRAKAGGRNQVCV